MNDTYRIDPGPEVTAAHPVVQQIVREHQFDVTVHDPFIRTRRTHSFAASFSDLMNGPKAYSTDVIVNPHMVCVTHCGRYGLGSGEEYFTYVDYPVPPTDFDFGKKFAPLLIKAIETHLARAKKEHDADHAADGPDGIYEASDAIVPLGPAGGEDE